MKVAVLGILVSLFAFSGRAFADDSWSLIVNSGIYGSGTAASTDYANQINFYKMVCVAGQGTFATVTTSAGCTGSDYEGHSCVVSGTVTCRKL